MDYLYKRLGIPVWLQLLGDVDPPPPPPPSPGDWMQARKPNQFWSAFNIIGFSRVARKCEYRTRGGGGESKDRDRGNLAVKWTTVVI